ncbi:MAG: Mut7-C RNAse domain-containing protein [Phycisphaerae bacterium]
MICDAMLGGLARWLRAMGHDAAYEYGIDDADLVARAAAEDRMILTSDGPLLERNVITSGQVAALFVPRQLSRFQQLQFVIEALDLPRLGSRCMACGGELLEEPKHAVAGEVPPLAYRNCSRFWRCGRCGKLYWHGTHWQRIERKLDEMV